MNDWKIGLLIYAQLLLKIFNINASHSATHCFLTHNEEHSKRFSTAKAVPQCYLET